jgi:hypothetical protein
MSRGRFDFQLGRWVPDDDFLAPAPTTEATDAPAPGRWYPPGTPSAGKWETAGEGTARVEVRILRTWRSGTSSITELEAGLLGEDDGAAWVENGGLFFTGRRCSFVIGGQDVDPDALTRPVFFQGFTHEVTGLPLRDGLAVLVVPEGDGEQFRRDFAWFRRVRPTYRGPRQLPPCEPRPEGA